MKILLSLLQIFEAVSFYLALCAYLLSRQTEVAFDSLEPYASFSGSGLFSNTLIAPQRVVFIELMSSYFVDDWQTAITIITIFTHTGAGVGRVAETISRDNSCTRQMARSGPLSREIVVLARNGDGLMELSRSRFSDTFSRDYVARAEPRERLEKIYRPIKNLFTIVLDRRRAYPNHDQTTDIEPSTESNYLASRR